MAARPKLRNRAIITQKPADAKAGGQFSSQEDIELAKVYAMADPDWFCTVILQSPNDPWQSHVMHAAADAWKKRIDPTGEILPTKINHHGRDKITIRAMHGPGKTHLAAKLMHWFNFIFHGRIVATAPKQLQLSTRLWPEFYRVMQGAIGEYRLSIKWSASRIIWNQDPTWYAIAETGSQPENLAGHHDDFMLVVVDEASGVHEEMFPQIEAAQSTGKLVIILLIGNPTRTTGTFWASHNKREVSEQYFAYHIQLKDAPRVKQKYVDDQIRKYGINSPVVQVRCFGNFAETEPDQLIALEWLENAKGRQATPDRSPGRIRVSVDVADGGLDECVFTVARLHDTYTVLLRIFRKSWPSSLAPIEAAKFAHQLYLEWGNNEKRGDDIVVDSMGVGAGTAGYLMEKSLPVIAYKGGEESDDKELWRNRRTQSYLVMRNGFRDKWIHIDEQCFEEEGDWDDFLGQMCSIKRKPNTERVEDLETKQELLKRTGKSPDLADSPAMVFCTARPTMGSIPGDALLAAAPAQVTGEMQSVQLNWGTTVGGNAASLNW